jgi:hypothetical protein
MHQFRCGGREPIGLSLTESQLDENILSVDVAEVAQAALESFKPGFLRRSDTRNQESHPRGFLRLLRLSE